MKTFRRMIHKGLETQKAMDLLNLPIDNFETKIPILPSGGEIFLYRAETHRDIDNWRKDGYRWCNRGTSVMTINRCPALRKSFFYLITKEGQKNGFQKHVYRLFDNENKVVIHYLGDETLNKFALPREPRNLSSTLRAERFSKASVAKRKIGTSEVCSNHFVDGCPTVMNPLPTLNIDPPPKDTDSAAAQIFKLTSKRRKSHLERNPYNKSQDQSQKQQQQPQQQIAKFTETIKNTLQRSPNKVLEQLQCVEESRNEKLLKHMLYQMSPQTQNKPQQKLNISAALGKPINTERSRKSPLNTASTSHSIPSNIEVENASPPVKKAREIHIDIDESDEEPTVVSKPILQPTIESPVQKSTSVKSAPNIHNSVLDINAPPKQKRILVVPNHQQSVMSNLSSLWKAGRLCDAFISNGTVNVKVHKMILGAVCPKVLDVFYNTPQHKLPKVTFPSHVSKEALLAFAEYMYNGVLDLDPELLTQMRVIAQRLDMKDFEQLCSNQLKSHMVPNMLPTILEPMLSEPCSSSGLIQQMSPQGNQTSVMEVIPTGNRSLQKDVYTSDSITSIPSVVSNSSVSLSNLPLVEVRAETDASLMEVVNNNLSFPAASDNICDDNNTNSRTLVKIEKVDTEDQQYGRVPVSSGITYSTSDSINTSNFTHFSNTDLSESPSSSTSQHTNSTQNKSLPTGHTWKQSKGKTSTGEDVNPADPYPINLFTANWANVPLQDIKKEYNVG